MNFVLRSDLVKRLLTVDDFNDNFELLLGTDGLALGTHYIPFWLNCSLPEFFTKLIQTGFTVQIIGTTSHYREECRGYNGDDLYSYCITSNSGLRQKGKWDEYGNSYFTFSPPLFLLGKDCCTSDERTLIDLLSENVDSINLIRQDEHEITLSCDYHYGSSDKPKTRNVTVTLDPQHGFLPKYAEFKRIPFNVLTTRMKITKFTETSNGILFPIEALDEEFYMDEPIQEDGVHYQNGMTADELLAMTEEDRWKVIPSLGYRSVHLSTLTYRVNPKTLKINEPFDESLLTLDRFPDGMYVWDDILQLGYKVGRFDDPNYVGAAKTETWWTVVRILLIAVGTVIVFLGIGLLLKKRFAVKTE